MAWLQYSADVAQLEPEWRQQGLFGVAGTTDFIIGFVFEGRKGLVQKKDYG